MEPKVFRNALISSYRVKMGRTRKNKQKKIGRNKRKSDKQEIFIVPTVRRKVLYVWSQKKESTTTQNLSEEKVQCNVVSERRNAQCAITKERHCHLQLRLQYLKNFNV